MRNVVQPKTVSWRPKELTPRLKRKIRKEALKNPVISSRELAAMVQSTSGVEVTSRTAVSFSD